VSRPAAPSLWRSPDYMRLWSATAVSEVGSEVTVLALPLAAILVLHATPFEVGLLGACQLVPFLVLGLPAGVWVDRMRRRPVMIASDLLRAALLAAIPLLDAVGALDMPALLAIAAATGALWLLFDVAYQSYLPDLTGREGLVEGNAKLEIARSGGQIAGPALGGGLIQALGAPVAVLVDAASFVGSAVLLWRIRRPEHAPTASGGGGMRAEIAEGLRYVLREPLLRAQAASTGIFNLFSSMFSAVFLLYATRVLHLSAGTIGLVFAAGTLSVPLAGVLGPRIGARIGLGPSIVAGALISVGAAPLVIAAPVSAPVPWLVAGFLLLNFGVILYRIGQLSLRQAITPERMLGRMNATMRFIVWGVLPLGSLVGGVLGGTIGLGPTLAIGIGGTALGIVPVVMSPIRAVRDIPDAPAPEQVRVLAHVQYEPHAQELV
jgi:MFS family permease